MTLAEHAFFIERGEVRFDGPTAELLTRDDLLRPVFLADATRGVGIAGVSVPSFVLVEGVVTGLSYGLLALGLVLIYRTNRVLNFAQGQLGVVAAVFMAKVADDWQHQLLDRARRRAAARRRGRRALRAHAAPDLQPAPGPGDGRDDRALAGAVPAHRAAVHPPEEAVAPVPRPDRAGASAWAGSSSRRARCSTLIVAPIVALSVAAFIRYSRWGLAMRAMAENADSARLSGVWVRRTSTVAWTLAGVLSAFTAILNAPGQTSVLTEVLSPDLLRARADRRARRRDDEPHARVRRRRSGSAWWWRSSTGTSPIPATVELILFGLLLVVLLLRVAGLQKGSRVGDRSTWSHGAADLHRRADAYRQRVGNWGVGVAVLVVVLLPFVVSPGRSFLLSQICIYAVIALSLTGPHRLGRAGLARPVRPRRRRARSWPPTSATVCRSCCCCRYAGAVTAVVAVLVGSPRTARPRSLPRRQHARVRVVHAGRRCSRRRARRCR